VCAIILNGYFGFIIPTTNSDHGWAQSTPVADYGIGQSKQIMSLFMIEVIIFVDRGVPKGRKNMTKHDKTRHRS
jgi:hypothetical protein